MAKSFNLTLTHYCLCLFCIFDVGVVFTGSCSQIKVRKDFSNCTAVLLRKRKEFATEIIPSNDIRIEYCVNSDK